LRFPENYWNIKLSQKATRQEGKEFLSELQKVFHIVLVRLVHVPIKEQVTLKHGGVLYLTSDRIIFASTGKNSFTIKFDKLLTFEVYSDGIGFVIEGWTYLVELTSQQIELFATGLTSSLRNYLDEENDTRQKAQKEIDDNETFVNISHG
jgi:hypothetical protein